MISGGCLCGKIRYRLDGAPALSVNCHCRMCRKHSGSAFLTYYLVQRAALHLEGDAPVAFRSSTDAVRAHCGSCGSPLTFVFDADSDNIWVTLGSLDDPNSVTPHENWFVKDKLDWVALDHRLKNFENGPSD
ncbi:GFA family protein [Pararhizobium arenae]|uniref:GFA family protein n=1 Tax=Pararhizobium arenae TaxID=1856850 RepID=UPI00094ABBBE